ncbi:MAG: flagellar basal body-associated FliL family protein [Alphaproteobacteria bacterium]
MDHGIDGLHGQLMIGLGEPKKKKLSGKKIVLFGVLPLLLLVGGGAGVFFSGLLGGDEEETAEAEMEEVEEEIPREVVFYDLPEMLVNLNSAGRESSFLKIQVSLELDSADAIPEVEAMLPRIIDNFQVYLRELRPEELSGTKGVVRLKEELLVRVNGAVDPIKVYDILFKEILVQG